MRTLLTSRLAAVIVVVLSAACGSAPPIPPRGVVEADLGSWRFRRFQPVLDVEVWIDGNAAEAYTASYVADAAEKRGRVEDEDIVNVFVTRYAQPDGVVRETVRLARRLAAEQGYQVDEREIGDLRALSILGNGEAWVLWPAERHVIKVGGRGRTAVPDAMVEPYGERYPSRLPGGSLEGPLPPGPAEVPAPAAPYDPANPRPDLDRYDPDGVRIPERGVDAPDTPVPRPRPR